MADGSKASNPTPLISSAPPRRRAAAYALTGLLGAGILILLGWWVIAGNKIWTDGAAVHVSDAEARLREVIWTHPEPLAGLNTPEQEYEPSVSPDGDELYFVRGKAGLNPSSAGHNADIYVSYRRMGAWTTPVAVDAINSEYDDLGPRVTGDGKFLLFYSNRPGGLGGYDIWAAPRLTSQGNQPGGWGKPFNLGPSINSEFDEYNPDPSPDGKQLFFSTNRKGAALEQKASWRATIRAGAGADFDLWYAQRVAQAGGGEQEAVGRITGARDLAAAAPATEPATQPATQPVTQPDAAPALEFANAAEVPGVNTPYAEGASCMSPAGDFLYFASDRPGGFGRFDIYRCRVTPDGKFGPVENLGPGINTSDNETDPQLALNGFRLYFSSDRPLPGTDAAVASTDPASSGHYDLLQSDSREVYAQRTGHPLPHLSWSWLVLAVSLLCLVPLVMFMRKWDDQHLNLIQRCLLVSVLVHLLITLGLSLTKVSKDVYHYVRVEQGLEPPVDLSLVLNGPAGQSAEIGAAIRQQTSVDLPTSMAPPTAAAQQASPDSDVLDAPSALRVDAPGVRADPSGTMVQIAAPSAEPSKAALEAVRVAPVLPPAASHAELTDLKIETAPRVTQAESVAQNIPVNSAPAARVEPGVAPTLEIPEIKVGSQAAAPVAPPAGSLAESATVTHPSTPIVDARPIGALLTAPISSEPVREISQPRPTGISPVATAGPDAPTVAENVIQPGRISSSNALPTDVHPNAIQSEAPAVANPNQSAASESITPQAPRMRAADAVASAVLPRAVAQATPAPAAPEVITPRSSAGPLASLQPDSPKPAELLAAASREGHSSGPGGSPAMAAQIAASQAPALAAPRNGQGLSPDAPTNSHGNPTAPAVAVTPVAPNSASSPAVGSLPQGLIPIKTVSARPEVQTRGEVVVSQSRQGQRDQATTQPAGADLSRLSGLADAAPAASGGAIRSLAAPIEPSSGASRSSPVIDAPPAQVADSTQAAPVGPIAVTMHLEAAPKRINEASPSAGVDKASTSVAGAMARSAASDPLAHEKNTEVAIAVTAASAAGEKTAAGPAAPAASAARPLDTATALAMAAPTATPPGHGLRDFASAPEIRTSETALAPLAALANELQGSKASDVTSAPRKATGGDAGVIARPRISSEGVAPVAAGPSGKGTGSGESLVPIASSTPRTIVAESNKALADRTTKIAGAASVNFQPPSVTSAKVASGPAEPTGILPGAAGPAGNGVSRTNLKTDPSAGRPAGPVLLASASIPGVSELPVTTASGKGPRGDDPSASRTTPRAIAGPLVSAPGVFVALPKLTAPEALFQRSPEQRKPLVQKRGGTPESEGAVDRALAYLSREQEADGRWTVFSDDAIHPGGRGRHPHDMACTGLATLAFLTADHTPAKEGPYRDVVARSLDFLISKQGPDGDLRGPKDLRGGGADQGNLYDHGICTMALSEAALMTGDRRYTDAAEKAAAFIIASQNPQGGWRYTPGESGDTSVVGWQVLALHDAEQLGFQVPDLTRSRAVNFIKSVSQGDSKILASYMASEGATSPMTAEALFVRMLLGVEISEAQSREVSAYLTRELPDRGNPDFYFWYYASLSLSQMSDVQGAGHESRNIRPVAAGAAKTMSAADAWKKWNARTRDTLIAMQKKGGAADGSWSDSRWAERGGHVFTTALATLTLEVYYRYLPLRASTDDSDPSDNAQRASATLHSTGSAMAGQNPARSGSASVTRHPKGWKDEGGHYPGVEPN